MKKTQIQEAYEKYKISTCFNIFEAYKKPSADKQDAWNWCKHACMKNDGNGLKIIGKNLYSFSAGFTFINNGKKFFYYITKDNVKVMETED